VTLEVVDVYLKDDTSSSSPVAGVKVRFYAPDGYTFIQEATTDSSGHVSVMLDAPANYQLRFFKTQVSFQQPIAIAVVVPTGPPPANAFDAVGHVFSPPEAVDPRMCRCSGYFRNPDGSPAPNTDIQISPQFDPLLLDGAAIMTERVRLITDQTGYVQVDLIRFGKFDVQVEGMEDWSNEIAIPDLASANLPDLLFAVVDHCTFQPAGPYSLAVGQELTVTPTIYWSDGNVEIGTGPGDVQWSTDDTSIAVVRVSPTSLTLVGIATGIANLLASRVDTSIVRVPNTPIGGVDIPITVA
jgi:hypothetical protein